MNMLGIEINKLIDVIRFSVGNPMFFNSGLFLFFFLFVILGYSFVKNNQRNRSIYLALLSFYFYYKSSGIFLLILIFTTISDYLIGNKIASSVVKIEKKRWLMFSVIVNLSVLSYFKYTNFFAEVLSSWMNFEFTPFAIILPIGISFFTFQSMSYTIDIYNGEIKPVDRYIDYAFFVSFFPQLVAGPIVRAKDFVSQIKAPTVVTSEMFGRALFLILSGLFKKMVISDYISINFVDRIFDNPTLYSGVENLFGIYGYALQIYCDFSGYSDIAIGLALLLGFHFGINFNSPYQSQSITEFWRRWHISLSSWLKDYLYVPLGGNRRGVVRMYVNLLITMLLGGLWHGASWLFIIWGAWHGLLLVIDKLRLVYFSTKKEKANNSFFARIKRVGAIFLTFNLVCIGWVFFRASSLEKVGEMASQIFTDFKASLFPQLLSGYPTVFLLVGIGAILHLLPQRYEMYGAALLERLPLIAKAAVVAFFIFLLVQVRSSEILPFIYFQF
ncbi:MAG: MBOAT family O-acyltransferase [Phocaeicola sp.]